MCAIAGITGLENIKQALLRMVGVQTHRGPDAQQVFIAKKIALGHNRLSIIDLSEKANQPMTSSTGKSVIIFNGEIYGYKQIREKIDWYEFKTHSDTEVILALYEKYGTQMFKHLPGMFAFAIWDFEKHQLLLARDRFGEKPLFYSILPDGSIVFASEIKAILASGLIGADFNYSALPYFLRKFYIPPDRTIFENIKPLLPGHYLVWHNYDVKVQRYWKYPKTSRNLSFIEATEKFRFLFEQSVKKQLVADVEVAVFLSGGIDSAALALTIADLGHKPKAFTYAYEGKWDESRFAQYVAKQANFELYITRDEQINKLSVFEKVYKHIDQPNADTAILPTYILSHSASQQLKVVLAGDGADEMLGGYGSYLHFRKMMNPLIQNPVLAQANRAINKLFDILKIKLPNPFIENYNDYLRWKKFTNLLDYYVHYDNFFSGELLNQILKHHTEENYLLPFEPEENANDFIKLDIFYWLTGNILYKTDIASMQNSLEIRAPYLDKDLAEFLISLPVKYKIKWQKNKLLLRQAYKNKLPKQLLNRKIKQGFGAPVNRWLQDPEINELFNDLFVSTNSKINNILTTKAYQLLQNDKTYKKWILLTLAYWLEHFPYPIKF